MSINQATEANKIGISAKTDISNNTFSTHYQNRIFFYFILISGTILILLKLPMAQIYYEAVSIVLTFAPMIVIIVMATLAFFSGKGHPEYISIIRKFYLTFTLKLLFAILVFYFLYAPFLFITPLIAGIKYLQIIATLEGFFYFLSYFSIAIIALAIVFVCFRAYQKSSGKYTGSIRKLSRQTLYTVFAIFLLMGGASALAYPEAYKPLTNTLGDTLYTLSAGNVQMFKGDDFANYKKIKTLGDFATNLSTSLAETGKNISQSNVEYKNNLEQATTELQASIAKTNKDLKNKINEDVSESFSISGGTITGDVTIDKALTIDNTTYSKSIIPQTNSSFDLGSSEKSFSIVYVSEISGINSTLQMNANLISGLKDPAGAQDAATKNYVDTYVGTQITGINFWQRTATTISPLTANDSLNLGSGGVTAGTGNFTSIIESTPTLIKLNQSTPQTITGTLTLPSITVDTNTLYIDSSNHRVGIGNVAPGALLDIGLSGTTQGVIRLEGSTSGYAALQPTAAAGSVTITMPATTGTMALTTSAMTGTFDGLNLNTGNQGGVPYYSATGTLSSSAAGISGKALISGGTGAPTWYTPTAGSVLFAGTSGILAQDNTGLFWDDTNNYLGIGTATPGAQLEIVGNTINHTNSWWTNSSIRASGTLVFGLYEPLASNILERSRGTHEAPEAVQSGDNLGNLIFAGYSNAWGRQGAIIYAKAAENYAAATNLGSNLYFGTVPIGSGTMATRMTILNSGDIGIGTTAPESRLQVSGGGFCVGNDATCNTDNDTEGVIYAVSNSVTAADYAEYFKTKESNLKSGEVVCVDTQNDNAVKRCQNDGDNNVMGVVSTNPGIVGNDNEDVAKNPEDYAVIAMLGQIPGYVTNENGAIQIGDALTASSTAGYMRKADSGESTVGVALQNFTDSKGQIQILISRKNKSLTVDAVETQVTQRIAELNVQDQVNNLISQAKANLQDNLSQAQTQINNQGSLLADIQSQIEAIKAKYNLQEGELTFQATEIESLKIILGINPEKPGDINILGKLTAEETETGKLIINVSDEAKKTIGEGKIEKDKSKLTISSLSVDKYSKVFVTPRVKTSQSLAVTEIKDGEFTVEVNDPISSEDGLMFDWWIVEVKK